MAGQTPLLHDFVAETKGNCFLCSNRVSLTRVPSDFLPKQSSPSYYSLHCLSRYLRIDMRKVFTGNDPIPPRLLARVEKSRLKAELCEECAVLTEHFSKLFRKHEKIQMEITSCLGNIHDKLERTVGIDKGDSSDDELMAKLEITKALRNDALQKCSRKLQTVLPFSKLERLTLKKVNAERLKIVISRNASAHKSNPSPTRDSEPNYEGGKSQSPASIPLSDVYGDDFGDEQNHSSYSTMPDEELGGVGKSVSQEALEETLAPDEPLEDLKFNVDKDTQQDRQTSRTGTKLRRNTEIDKVSQSIPPPIEVTGGVGQVQEKPNVIKILETGKYRCQICSREYATRGGFGLHYKSTHLKMNYKCSVCHKDFRQKRNYEDHFSSIHFGVKFKCMTCGKTFTQKHHLKHHLKNGHSERLRCKYCPKTFEWPISRNAHMKKCSEKL